MDVIRLEHALEPIKSRRTFMQHATLAAGLMDMYRDKIIRARAHGKEGEFDLADRMMREAFDHRSMARDIMFPYRKEFKFRAWYLAEATADTQVRLVHKDG